MPKTIRLRWGKPESWLRKIEGRHLTDEHFTTLIENEDTDVFKPNGSVLLKFRKKRLPAEICEQAFEPLKLAAMKGKNNRKTAAGGSFRPRRKSDGKLMNYVEANPAQINHFGFTKKGPTSYTKNHRSEYDKILPLAQALDQAFQEITPKQYKQQRKLVDLTNPEYVIEGSSFSTLYVTRNWRTATHKDGANFGLAVMAPITRGSFTGGLLVFPKWDIAVSLKTGDVLVADVATEYHGNTSIESTGTYDRLMTVSYFTSKLAIACPATL